ncbi:MAG: hypothetical protein AVDCRST_MAG40-2711, partial [uncultured Gemmatimonadaceae bacterium]
APLMRRSARRTRPRSHRLRRIAHGRRPHRRRRPAARDHHHHRVPEGAGPDQHGRVDLHQPRRQAAQGAAGARPGAEQPRDQELPL